MDIISFIKNFYKSNIYRFRFKLYQNSKTYLRSLINYQYHKINFITKYIELFLPGLIKSYKITNKEELNFEKFLLARDSKSILSLPKNHRKKTYLNSFAEIYGHHIKNVKFKTNSSCLIQANNFYVDSLVYNKPLDYGCGYNGFLKYYPFLDHLFCSKSLTFRSLFLTKANLKEDKIINIENGIFIGGDGSDNWYHWIIEYLPKLFISDKLPDQFNNFPLIVPNICRKNKNFYDALAIFNKLNRKLIFFRSDDIIFAKNLIYIDNVCSGPFQLLNNSRPSYKDYKQHDDLLLQYSSEFKKFRKRNLLNKKINITSKKIFLARKNSYRTYNQAEIFSISEKYGFKEVYLEKLSLQEQNNLFASVEFVVGPSGAAWTGMIFSKENKLKCLTWMPDYLNEACTFSNLATLLGHELNYILFENKERKNNYNFHYNSYNLDINLFEDKLNELISD